jgi:hypothetical protein
MIMWRRLGWRRTQLNFITCPGRSSRQASPIGVDNTEKIASVPGVDGAKSNLGNLGVSRSAEAGFARDCLAGLLQAVLQRFCWELVQDGAKHL